MASLKLIQRRRIPIMPLLLTAALLAIVVYAWQEQKAQARQMRLNHALFAALDCTFHRDNDIPAVRAALVQGADPNARMPSFVPPPTPWQALREWFSRLRRRQPPPQPEMRITALTWAAYNRDTTSVTDLLDRGAYVDGRSDDGRTVICRENGWPMTSRSGRCFPELLTDKLVDEPLPNQMGQTPGITALMIAAGNCDDPTLARLLLDHGADVNAKDGDGDTPLMNALAAYSELSDFNYFSYSIADTSTLRLLLNHGADVNTRDRWGRTPLMLAAEAQSTYAARLLLAKGAEAGARDASGQTAFHYASLHGVACEKRLLKQFGVTH